MNKVFISCGEMSGDMHASYLVDALKKEKKNLQFYGVVGDKSIKAGVNPLNHIKKNDIMGFTEVIKKYRYFKKKAYEYMDFIRENNIDTIIFIDFGGFNLKFFKLLKKNKIKAKMIYYIPPKVWAWGKQRIYKLKDFDEVIVIFPFEQKYFDKMKEKTGFTSKYFGNPLVDIYSFRNYRKKNSENSDKYNTNNYYDKNVNFLDVGNENKNIILLLPGSRKQEINKYIPVIFELLKTKKMEKEQFVLKLADKSHIEYIYELEKKYNMSLNNFKNLYITYESIEKYKYSCKYAIATSGTVTFELALMGIPTIVVYKTSIINAFIAKKILKVKYITLTNINAEKMIFPELLQENFNVEQLLIQTDIMNKNLDIIEEQLQNERVKLGESGVLSNLAKFLLK